MNECNGFGDEVLTVRLVVGRELVLGVDDDGGKQLEVVDNDEDETGVEEG